MKVCKGGNDGQFSRRATVMYRMVRKLQGANMVDVNRSRAWRVVFYDSSIVYGKPTVTFSYKSLDNEPECTRNTTAAGITA